MCDLYFLQNQEANAFFFLLREEGLGRRKVDTDDRRDIPTAHIFYTRVLSATHVTPSAPCNLSGSWQLCIKYLAKRNSNKSGTSTELSAYVKAGGFHGPSGKRRCFLACGVSSARCESIRILIQTERSCASFCILSFLAIYRHLIILKSSWGTVHYVTLSLCWTCLFMVIWRCENVQNEMLRQQQPINPGKQL